MKKINKFYAHEKIQSSAEYMQTNDNYNCFKCGHFIDCMYKTPGSSGSSGSGGPSYGGGGDDNEVLLNSASCNRGNGFGPV